MGYGLVLQLGLPLLQTVHVDVLTLSAKALSPFRTLSLYWKIFTLFSLLNLFLS
jgi:hypothetical protein